MKLKKLIEIVDEITEQVILDKNPDADIYKDVDGKLRMKKRYGPIRERVYNILKNNLQGVKA